MTVSNYRTHSPILDQLMNLAEVGTVIACTEITLHGADHAPPIVVGTGEISVLTSTEFGYTIRGKPNDNCYALTSLRRIDADPYDGALRARLTVVTQDGLKLDGGWTIPKVHLEEDGQWVFTGEIDSLSCDENGTFSPGTKVIYLLPQQHWSRIIFRCFFPPTANGELQKKNLVVLGSEVTLTLDDDADLLIIDAPESQFLIPAFAENWLGEPLRILFGQLIFPRFVLRQSEKWSMAWVRPSPCWKRDSDGCGLWQWPNDSANCNGFWETYRQLLALVVSARDKNSGNPNFEEHKLTGLYREIIQGSSSSRWVRALIYASAAEALLNMLGLVGNSRTDIVAADLEKLTETVTEFNEYIGKWGGCPDPVKPAQNAASRLLKMSPIQSLRHLRDTGGITQTEYNAWNNLRQRVMHGSLVSPYSSKEEDELFINLAGLFRVLTQRLLTSIDLDAVPIKTS